MNAATQNCLVSHKLGEPKVDRYIVVFPLISPPNDECNRLTLRDAIGSNPFLITEVSRSGSVPELKVINRGNKPVLLIDGEEPLLTEVNACATFQF